MTTAAAVFLDRDGTLIEEVGYLDRPERVQLYPWTVDAIRALNRAGLRSAFGRRFTNQHVGYICRRDGLAGRKPRSLPETPGASGPVET